MDRTYQLFGIPLRSGSLYPGNENDAQAYREAGLAAKLRAAGCKAEDNGDIAVPSFLPHHSIPPIRSWPGPRIVWDVVSDKITPLLGNAGHVPVLLGCDCSAVVGSAQALARAGAGDIHVIYIDGDFDDAPPDSRRAQSAAAMAVWLLTHESPFWSGPPLKPSQVHVIGWTKESQSGNEAGSVSLAVLRSKGIGAIARQVLASVPAGASILLHFDIDSIRQQDMPASYFPHVEGLSLPEAATLFGHIVADPRVRLIEISEYAALRDLDQRYAKTLADLLAQALGAATGPH